MRDLSKTSVKRTLYGLALVAVAIWGASKGFGLCQTHFPDRNHPATPALHDMQTVCVGNYLIDLPRGSEPVLLETDLAGNRSSKLISRAGKSRTDFQRQVANRWDAVKDLKKDGQVIFDQPAQRFETMADGVVITFNHHTTDLKSWPDGSTGPKSFYDTEGYLWRDGILYVFTSGLGKEGVIKAMQSIQVRRNDEIPFGKGFCGGLSFFSGEPDPMGSVEFAFLLPIDTKTEFRIKLPTGQSKRPDLTSLHSDDVKAKTLRMASRIQSGLAGSEWMEYAWMREGERDSLNLYATWFGHDKHLSVPPTLEPAVISSGTGFPGAEIQLEAEVEIRDQGAPPPKLGEMIAIEGKKTMSSEDFTALWDGVVPTLRRRPGNE